MSLEIKSI